MENPLGIDEANPVFSWKLKAAAGGVLQKNCRIGVYSDSVEQKLVWDSGVMESGRCAAVRYEGPALLPCTRYYWMVSGEDQTGSRFHSRLSWFETGLMNPSAEAWEGAQWIGSPRLTTNTAALTAYRFQTDFFVEPGNKAGIVLAARNKDNFILFEVDLGSRLLTVREFCDNAWEGSMADGNMPTVTTLGRPGGYPISLEAVPEDREQKFNRLVIEVRGRELSVSINGCHIIWHRKDTMPQADLFMPRKSALMNVGFRQLDSRAAYRHILISDLNTRSVLQKDDFTDESGVLSGLGVVKNGSLLVVNRFELVNPVPSVNLRKTFTIDREVLDARLYASARGFYETRINDGATDQTFLKPGFTDYRLRIFYQTFDVTSLLKQGENTLDAVAAKGYYSGFVGYSGPMIYGEQPDFIGMLKIRFADGSSRTLVTDGSWLFSDRGPILEADYLDGESVDARLKPVQWRPCGVHPWPEPPVPTNGSFKEQQPAFALTAQCGPSAVIERTLSPVSMVESPPGHFVYDLGQNIVGTIRLRVRGEKGLSLKLRYGEMSYPNGEIYIRNLRSAANTDIYTLSGSLLGEEFCPSLTAHGFRYVEITGNGFLLSDISCVQGLEGLVLTNTPEMTGHFSCSDPLINRLHSNIEWGQRGNFLLVPTDCPQRNERCGWTGDAQVFAATAAFNMDIRAFMDKYLGDIRDGQLMYNRDGAVPDTAPLGGDNRPAGCAGWADAAVIIPWEMYLAYGDPGILERNYECMRRWVAYQSMDSRQNYGLRTVDHRPVPEQSDLASIPFIQVQQSRGDHLTFDPSTPFILTATAYAAYVASLMARIAAILGKKEDAAFYQDRFEKIRQAFREAWVQPDGSLAYWGEMSKGTADDTGVVINRTRYSNEPDNPHHPSQTAYALAIDFDLMPEETMSRTTECFVQSILERQNHLSVGFLGISHLLPALTKAGRNDLAFALLEQKGNPGWLYSVINGATTIWERWNSYIAETGTFGDVSMNSFNHYAYGAVGEWLHKTVLGINTGTGIDEAGYRRIHLQPVWGGSLTFANGSLESPCGRIESSWELSGDTVLYSCTVPCNATARLVLPDADTKGGVFTRELLPGHYEFRVKR